MFKNYFNNIVLNINPTFIDISNLSFFADTTQPYNISLILQHYLSTCEHNSR